MARFANVDPKTASPEVKQIFETALKGKEVNLFKALAVSPAALKALVGMMGALGGGTLSAKEREAIGLALAEVNGCGYCVAAHTAIGKSVGMTVAETVRARRGEAGDARTGALLKFTLALHEKRGRVSDADVAAFKAAGYTDAGVAEAVGNYALNIFTNYFNHVNETAVDFPAVAAA